jgi:hypothetical protein
MVCAAGMLSAAFSGYYARSRPEPAPVAPEDSALQGQLAGLEDSSPGILARLESDVSAARALLPLQKDFDAWMGGWPGSWTVLAHSEELRPGFEARHYALAFNHPELRSWSDIVRTVEAICSEPGVTLDSLSLAASPEGTDAFAEAQITLTIRLRR